MYKWTRERENGQMDKRERMYKWTRDTDTDTWFIVKATDPYTRRELRGRGWVRG